MCFNAVVFLFLELEQILTFLAKAKVEHLVLNNVYRTKINMLKIPVIKNDTTSRNWKFHDLK